MMNRIAEADGMRRGGAERRDVLTAVSYTHLDVYKRQTMDISPAPRPVLEPVSYTHLDVYKRQAQQCACPPPEPGGLFKRLFGRG